MVQAPNRYNTVQVPVKLHSNEVKPGTLSDKALIQKTHFKVLLKIFSILSLNNNKFVKYLADPGYAMSTFTKN